MDEAIEKFVNAQKGRGLFLLDMPTGAGKTFNSIKFIDSHLKGNFNIFYLTPLTKNVDDVYNDCLNNLDDSLKETFASQALRIKANDDSVIENLEKVAQQIDSSTEIHNTFFKMSSYYPLLNHVRQYNSLKSQGSSANTTEIIKTAEEQIRDLFEPDFRRDIENFLKRAAKTSGERYKLIRTKYPFLIDLYPSIESSNKHIFFMTMDKFYLGNSTIIEPSYKFADNSITKDALIIIDEIDSTKEVILKQEISESVKQRVDIFKLFAQINSAFETRKFQSDLFKQKTVEDDENTSRKTFDKIKNVFAETAKQFNLDRSFKYKGKANEDKSFLFDDYTITTINSQSKVKIIHVDEDPEKTTNVLKVLDFDENKSVSENFYRIISSVNGALSYFAKGIAMISRNYMNWRNQNLAITEARMEPDAAISSVLDCFNLDSTFTSVLSRMVNQSFHIPNKETSSSLDYDFYQEGFRYYSFSDDIRQDLTTKIAMVYLTSTPESYLIQLANHSMVLGLSATANLYTVTGNYDLNYIKKELGERFYHLEKVDQSRIEAKYAERMKANQSIILPEMVNIDFNPSKPTFLSPLFNNEEYQNKINEFLSTKEPNPKEKYNVIRFLKVCLAIKEFLDNPRSKVLLAITNRNIKTDSSNLFSLDNIAFIINAVASERKIIYSYKPFTLFGKGFAENRDAYRKAIGDKEKVILFSSYPASGTGQNLQYEEFNEAAGKIIEKDIDSLYLERPTNLLVNSANELSEEDLLKLICQAKSLEQAGDISPHLADEMIKQGFNSYMNRKSYYHLQEAYECQSINNHAVKIIEQAVGRICRVNAKDSEVHIYADKEIFEKVSFESVENKPLPPEFRTLINLAHTQTSGPSFDVNKTYLNLGIKHNLVSYGKLNTILSDNRKEWNEAAMEEWKELRDFVLKNPTINDEILDQYPQYKCCYLHAPQGLKINTYCTSKSDYDEDYLSYSQDPKHPIKYSSDIFKLNLLVKNKAVQAVFQKGNYSQTFNIADNILLPQVFQRIYQGALGEVIGKELLHLGGIELSEITKGDVFEKFDFCLSNTPDVYVDFKDWAEPSAAGIYPGSDRETEIAKALGKLQAIKGKKAAIINILGCHDHHYYFAGEHHEILIIPTLLDDSTFSYSCHALNYKVLREFLLGSD